MMGICFTARQTFGLAEEYRTHRRRVMEHANDRQGYGHHHCDNSFAKASNVRFVRDHYNGNARVIKHSAGECIRAKLKFNCRRKT
jgi:hypothetical protein